MNSLHPVICKMGKSVFFLKIFLRNKREEVKTTTKNWIYNKFLSFSIFHFQESHSITKISSDASGEASSKGRKDFRRWLLIFFPDSDVEPSLSF